MDGRDYPAAGTFLRAVATASQPPTLSLDDIAALIRSSTPYPLQSIAEDHEGVVAVIGTRTPDGQPAVSSMYWSRMQLIQAHYPDEMVRDLARGAGEGLARYIDSFTPPMWDQMQWGP